MPRKLNPHATPAQKAVTLFCRLMYTGSRHYLIDLAREMDCSKQTVMRMVEDIGRSYAVEVEKGRDGKRVWYRIRAPRSRPRTALSEEEINHLLLCKEMVRHLLPDGLSREVDTTIRKTAVLLPDLDNRAAAFESLAGAVLKGGIDYTPQERILATLLDAIATRTVCEIAYKSLRRTEAKRHYFAPLRIKSYHEALYVAGWTVDIRPRDVEPIHEMHLPIHRFTAAEPLRKTHSLRERESERCFGFPECDPFRVRVRLTPEAGVYAKERCWSADQTVVDRDDGACELAFTARSRTEVLSWVLSFGANAEVLDPPWLRDAVRSEVETLFTRYK